MSKHIRRAASRFDPKSPRRRRLARTLSRNAATLTAIATLAALVIVAQPALANASTSLRSSAPPHVARTTKVVGHIRNPKVCTLGSVSLPAPSAQTLAYLAEYSTNEVQVVDEATGAFVGSPITVGTNPTAAAYWQPPVGSTRDPLVIVSNANSHSVSIIDAVTQTVVATVSIPSGSAASSVSASSSEPYAIVVNHHSGKVSIINLTSYTDAGEITLTATTNALANVAFAPGGEYAYVTDPVDHKIFTVHYVSGTAPNFILESTWTNSSYYPSGIGTDPSSSSSLTLVVTSTSGTQGHLLTWVATETLGAPAISRFYPTDTPGPVAVSPGGTYAYVDLTDTNQVSAVNLSAGTATRITPSAGYTGLGAIGLSADGADLLSADTATSSVKGDAAPGGTALYGVSPDAVVTAIATPPPLQDGWDAFVTTPGSTIDVVSTATNSIVDTITDSAGSPTAIAASPDGKFVYVANGSSVSVIQTSLVSTTANPIVTTITGVQGSEPHTPTINALAVSPSGDAVLATDPANGAVYVIDTNPSDGASYRTVVGRVGLLGGTGSSTVTATGGLAFSPDGLYAYATEKGVSSNTYDGVTVLTRSSSTTTGYTYDAVDEALTEAGTTMITPTGVAVNPNGEDVYVTGTNSTDSPKWDLYQLPVLANGQITNNTTATALAQTGTQAYGVAFSPEANSAFVTNTGTEALTAVPSNSSTASWTSAVNGLGGAVAVSPDGLDVATVSRVSTCGGIDGVEFFDAGSGADLGGTQLTDDAAPNGVVIVPQASPQPISASELVGGASNPAETAVSSGMNDVVSTGSPSDAPGASAGVDTATGQYSMAVDSMTVPDVGIPLDVTATYDSARAATNGLLGYGWDYAYGITAAQNGTSCVVTVTFGDGSTTTFNPTTTSGTCVSRTYQSQGWAQATLTFQASCNGADSCFVVTLDAMTKYLIDQTTAQLVKIQDLNGNTVTLLWGSHAQCSGATSAQPCQVTGADTGSTHRTLTFSYPTTGSGTCPSGSYTCVVVTDPLLRTVTYVKNSSGQLVKIALSNTSSSATYAFTYTSTSTSTMTSWWDPNNNAAHAGSTTYATDVTWTSGKVTQVTGPQMASVAPLSTTGVTPTITFTYTGFSAGNPGNGTVLVDNPDFTQQDYQPGASQTLDTYAGYQLVSSVLGYGPRAAYYNGSTPPVVAPNPSESAYPMRDDYNLMPAESMNALAGTRVNHLGHDAATSAYDNGIQLTTYDVFANPLITQDEAGNSTVTVYNALNEPLVTTDAMGNQSVNTYNATGQLLTTTSPPSRTGGARPVTSSYYNANGTVCATRDAIETANYGALSSCVSAGTHATTYAYDAFGDSTTSTVTDTTTPSTVTSTTQSVYDAGGNVCATRSADGYAASGALSSCPSSGTAYATVTTARNVYNTPTATVSSLTVGGTNTYATTYGCSDADGNTVVSVGTRGSSPNCATVSPTTAVDALFTTLDAEGNTVQSIAPLATSGTQGPTSTAQFDANGSTVLQLSPQGFTVWAANHAATLTPYETSSLPDSQGNVVASMPTVDDVSTCAVSTSDPCPDTSITTFDSDGQQVAQVSAGNGQTTGVDAASTTSVSNPDGSGYGGTSVVAGNGTPQDVENTYDANGDVTGSVSEHWDPTCGGSGCWVTDSSTSTAYAPDGSTCWSSPTTVSTPTCSSPPTATSAVDYYDLAGHVVAEVGRGGSGVIGQSGYCSPTAALTTYGIDTTKLCAFTTYSAYNEAGQLVKQIQPSLSSTNTGFQTPGATTTYGYDASGNQTTDVNPAGNTVTTTYDAANRKTGISYSDTTDTIAYTYNADGTRATMVDSSGTTTFSYDTAGRLTSVTDGNSNAVTYGYNEFGQESCISYAGLGNDCTSTGASTDAPPAGDVTYDYDNQGRLQNVVDWNHDAFTYAYDCTGDLAWMAETAWSAIPTYTACQGSSGTVPATPAAPSSGTDVLTTYTYSTSAAGNLLTAKSTSAVSGSGSTPLLSFGSLTYDTNNNLTSSTPTVSGTAQTPDTYNYDTQQRVTSGPETSGSVNSYSYAGTSSPSTFTSANTVDNMGIQAMPESGASAQLGAEYAGNGQLCWVGVITSTHTGTCAAPGSTTSSYEQFNYDGMGHRTGSTSVGGYGSTSKLVWGTDTGTLSCLNSSGSTCTTPGSSTPNTFTYAYNGDGLRMTANSWNSTTSSTSTAHFTWNESSSALLSDGTIDYVYGDDPNVPLAQVNTSDVVASELLTDTSNNVRGVVEVTASAASPFALANSTDYDTYGNPITKSGGSTNAQGLTLPVGSDSDSASRFGYCGSYTDQSGYLYMVHRYYDPASTQFVGPDPAIAVTGQAYAYANDNPESNTDPLGLSPRWYWHNGGWHWYMGSAFEFECNSQAQTHCRDKLLDDIYSHPRGGAAYIGAIIPGFTVLPQCKHGITQGCVVTVGNSVRPKFSSNYARGMAKDMGIKIPEDWKSTPSSRDGRLTGGWKFNPPGTNPSGGGDQTEIRVMPPSQRYANGNLSWKNAGGYRLDRFGAPESDPDMNHIEFEQDYFGVGPIPPPTEQDIQEWPEVFEAPEIVEL